MVDLPTIPERIPTVTAPQSRVSSEQVAGPFTLLAHSMAEAGQELGQVAERVAEKEGYQSVRKDNDGNYVVDRSAIPILGPSADKFEHAAKFSYLAKMKPEIENKLTEIKIKHPNDPAAFMEAAETYRDTLLGREGDPAMGVALGKIIDENTSHHYRSALVELDRRNVSDATIGFKNELTGLDNKLAALARQGGVDTPEYQAALSDVSTIYRQLVSDPRFKYPPERVQQELEAMASRHRGEALIGRAMSIYDKATPTSAAEARKFLTETAWDPGLNLSPPERAQIVTRGLAALEGRTAENKALVDANKMLIRETIEGLKTSAPYDERRVNDLMDRSLGIGDVESYYKLASYKAFQPLRVMLAGASDEDRIKLYRGLSAPPPGLIDRIAQAESGGNAGAVSLTSSARGLGQFINSTWLDMVKRNRPDLAAGKSDAEVLALRTDPALSKEMIGAYATENRERLSAAGVRTDDAAVYLAHFLGPGDAIKVLKAAPGTPLTGVVAGPSIAANQGIFTRNPTPEKLIAWAGGKVAGASEGPATTFQDATRQELINDVARRVGTQTEGLVTTAVTALGRGRTLGAEEIRMIADGITISGRRDLLPKLEEAAAAYDLANGLTNQPASVRQALRGQLQTEATGADTARRVVIDKAEETVKAVERGMAETPYSTAAQRGIHQPPGAFDFANPRSVEVEAGKRVADQMVQRNYDGTGPISVFEGREADGFRQALTQGDPQKAAALLGVLNTLPADVLRATLTSDAGKAALDGMVRSYEPTRLNAAMSTLDRMWRSDPVGFEREFGAKTLDRMQVWQGWKDGAGPIEVAERFKRADDPSFAAAREALVKEANTELDKWKPADVMNAITERPFLNRIPFVAPSLPSDPIYTQAGRVHVPESAVQTGALKADFDRIYKDLRSYGGDADEAATKSAERLKLLWGTSNGQFMRHPPERYYPPDGSGSHDWMQRQLEDDVGKVMGRPRFDPLTGTVANDWQTRIVADAQTETDISAGRPPSYQVFVIDGRTGRIDAPRDAGGNAMRMRWDPAGPQAVAREEFGRRRGNVTGLFDVMEGGAVDRRVQIENQRRAIQGY